MNIFHLHAWTPWNIITVMDKRRNATWDMQERVCNKCGLTQRKGFI